MRLALTPSSSDALAPLICRATRPQGRVFVFRALRLNYPHNQMDDELVSIPISDVFDLHSVPGRDVKGVVEEYVREAHRLGYRALRIIHGRGIGVQRQTVRGVLSSLPFVVSFADAPLEAGGWGATVVTLR